MQPLGSRRELLGSSITRRARGPPQSKATRDETGRIDAMGSSRPHREEPGRNGRASRAPKGAESGQSATMGCSVRRVDTGSAFGECVLTWRPATETHERKARK